MKICLKNSAPKIVAWSIVASEAGKLLVGLSEKGETCRLSFIHKARIEDILAKWQRSWPQTQFIKSNVGATLTNEALLLVGTPFQHSVWQALTKIARGKVTSYAAIARKIGRPRAMRAVGTACGANPIPYLIPCHRVIASDGDLAAFQAALRSK